MCNKGTETLSESELESVCPISQEQQQQQQYQVVYLMDSLNVAPGPGLISSDEIPRVKFLCSFSGSILPRPHDGKLRYVGGETRIVSVPRDITYQELMAKMRELFEGASILKYQQPDEDLDALVSVVNDDDVTNMMEEYDKLGAGDGFTRLRIFLFSQADQDGSVHFVDGDERDNERRYVDALNSLNESPDYRRNQLSDSQFVGPMDDPHVALAEQFFSQTNLDSGLQNQRNTEMPMPHNLHQLTIPTLHSGQPQQSVSQRYNEMEAPWSPGYYSPRQPGHHDPRQVVEFPTSPSSNRYRAQYAEVSDKSFDRMPEVQMNHHPHYEHQPPYSDNLAVFPSEKCGFPGNILPGGNAFEGNSVCEHCRVGFQRNQAYTDAPWKPGEHQHLEPPNVGNGFHHVANPCAECPCPPNREILMMNVDANVHHPYYSREPDPRFYTENQSHERGWILSHPSVLRPDETRPHPSVAGRLSDHHIVDNSMSISHGHVNVSDSLYIPSHYVHPDDPRYLRAGPEVGQMFHTSTVSAGSHMHGQPMDERGVRYANPSYAYGHDNVYPVTHGHAPGHTLWRNIHGPSHAGPPHEASSSSQLASGLIGPGFMRVEASPSLQAGIENQNPWVESLQKIVGLDGSHVPDYSNGQALKHVPTAYNQENQLLYKAEHVRSIPDMLNIPTPVDSMVRSESAPVVDDSLVLSTTPVAEPINETDVTEQVRMDNNGQGGDNVGIHARELEDLSIFTGSEGNRNSGNEKSPELINSNLMEQGGSSSVTPTLEEIDTCAFLEKDQQPDDRLSCLPELIASAKKATLDSVEEVKSKVQGIANSGIDLDAPAKEEHQNEADASDTHGDLEIDSDGENSNNSKIELTKAEEEAINRGLQTIKNEDLEEIRELGSGTYGAVFYGKWRGSDVAIKRIKASCFAGRPSERERLISDFWKEALILSSLHHPNVVSFYGVVRDGPDGSLATVTEFMVNGSLKQFLQKKDRTIDRRKRLMIAMDTAFGMEYLHGKNIVHFDLKCENLLVNMRDPHRPVCKIGDLGLSKVKQHTLVSGGVRGTLPWMAPELLSGKSNMVSEKIDVYSYGIVMWELLTGDEPYKERHCASIIGGIVNNTLRPEIPTWCDTEWKSLMESCWAVDPAVRPSFSEISQKLRSMAAAMNLK